MSKTKSRQGIAISGTAAAVADYVWCATCRQENQFDFQQLADTLHIHLTTHNDGLERLHHYGVIDHTTPPTGRIAHVTQRLGTICARQDSPGWEMLDIAALWEG